MQNEQEHIMEVGCPHFKSYLRQYRSAGYTLIKALCEFIDNIIFLCSLIQISVRVDPVTQRLTRLKISDNYANGIISIHANGTSNPFNMSHMRIGQDDDEETSMYGIGMKAGGISTCNKLTVYTRVNEKYWKITCDFIRMSQEPDPNRSFNPTKVEITEDEYSAVHPYTRGSSFIFEDIHEEIYHSTDEKTIVDDIVNSLSEPYGEIIKQGRVNISVTNDTDDIAVDVEQEIDYPNEPECSPLGVEYKLFILENTDKRGKKFIIQDSNQALSEYNPETRKFNVIKVKKVSKSYGFTEFNRNWIYASNDEWRSVDSYSVSEPAAIIITGSFIMYHPDANDDSQNLPKGRVKLYMQGRCYGNWNHPNNNGSHNFTEIRMRFNKKSIAKTLGLTFSKTISKEQKNDLCSVIHEINKKIYSQLNGDTTTTANRELYKIAISKGIIVPEKRRPKVVKAPVPETYESSTESESEQSAAANSHNGGDSSHEEVPFAPEQSSNQEVNASSVQNNVIIDVEEHESDIESELEEVKETELEEVKETELEQEQESEPQQEQFVMDDNGSSEPSEPQEEDVSPTLTASGPSEHLRNTVKGSKRLLKKWFDSKEHTVELDVLTESIIRRYQEGTAYSDATKWLKYITRDQKYELMIECINEKYPIDTDDMLKGCEVYRGYRDAFPNE